MQEDKLNIRGKEFGLLKVNVILLVVQLLVGFILMVLLGLLTVLLALPELGFTLLLLLLQGLAIWLLYSSHSAKEASASKELDASASPQATEAGPHKVRLTPGSVSYTEVVTYFDQSQEYARGYSSRHLLTL